MPSEVLVYARFPVVVKTQTCLEFGDEIGGANGWPLRRNLGFDGVDIWLLMENLEVEDVAMQMVGF